MKAHFKGPTTKQLIASSIGDFFDDQVLKYSERDFLVVVHQNIRWTWNKMKERAESLARGLVIMGFEHGDRLGVWMPNNSEWVVAQIATAKIGVILVNLNPAYRTFELKQTVKAVGCKGVIIVPKFKQSDYVKMMLEVCPEISLHSSDPKTNKLRCKEIPTLEYVIYVSDSKTAPITGMVDFNDIYTSQDPDIDRRIGNRRTKISLNDAINIQFTSGTTGAPKGATLTHRNILNNGYFVGEQMKLTEKDRLCIPVPLYHCFGLVMGNLASITHGSTIIYPSAGFDAESCLQAIHKEKCTILHGVPTMFIAQLFHPHLSRYDLSSLRSGIMSGAPCPVEIMKKVMKDMHCAEITIAYGMTESSPVSFQSKVDTPISLRVETVGQLLPHVESKIIDSEGRTVNIHCPGEILTRGYNIMKGYWNQPDKTKESIDSDGFMHTGDMGVFDENGYLRVIGRIKDMIIRGGENLYPREIEEYLLTHCAEITIAYGMTESSPVSFQSKVDTPISLRVETVGQLLPHVESKIIDSEGRTVNIHCPGEILTRGYNIMKGYWNQPDKTKESIDSDGFMHTGDMGVFDENGYLRVIGRIKDMIIRGGENLYPREIEEYLLTHDGISDVTVVGVPDSKYGELTCAWIIKKKGVEIDKHDVIDFC
eukprot:TRINITY_DN7039_c0_g1_i1.p1 TRINITY_DN7039_c0_g1~~TRINITY_DN7039_c0_g1_i1.p1  ORF type:complete len:651 (+),score=131.70 TRINITY_DN7039_c0_g1_i1:45-1997(+)